MIIKRLRFYALQAGNGEALMKAVRQAGERGADWDRLLLRLPKNLVSHCHAAIIAE